MSSHRELFEFSLYLLLVYFISLCFQKVFAGIAVPIQMRYRITSQVVGARQCRALTGIPHGNENRYSGIKKE